MRRTEATIEETMARRVVVEHPDGWTEQDVYEFVSARCNDDDGICLGWDDFTGREISVRTMEKGETAVADFTVGDGGAWTEPGSACADARECGKETGSGVGMVTLTHGNARGCGSAMRLMLRPADGRGEGCVIMEIAPQVDRPAGAREFRWDAALPIRLGFTEVAKVMEVLRGCAESLEDGKGLAVRDGGEVTVMRMAHVIEPDPGYEVRLIGKGRMDDTPADTARFRLTLAEGLGLSMALEGAMARLAFGDPCAAEEGGAE